MLNPTPAEQMVDQQNRPYFMRELTLDRFFKGLEDPEGRAYLLAQVMRDGRPDDVFSFASPRELMEAWPQIEGFLGSQRTFWDWLLTNWEAQGLVWR